MKLFYGLLDALITKQVATLSRYQSSTSRLKLEDKIVCIFSYLSLALTCSALSKHIGQVTSRAVLTAVVSSFSLFSLAGLLWSHTKHLQCYGQQQSNFSYIPLAYIIKTVTALH